MHCEVRKPFGPEGVRPGIGPHVAAVPSILPEAKVINMFAATMLPDENQFMLAAIETAIARVGFVPDNEILKLAIDATARSQHFVKVPPIRAYKMNGTVHRVLGEQTECVLKKLRKLRGRFFAACLDKVVMFDTSLAGDGAKDS
jgi:hypothetical protein